MYIHITIDPDDNKKLQKAFEIYLDGLWNDKDGKPGTWGGGFTVPKDKDKREQVLTSINNTIRYMVNKIEK